MAENKPPEIKLAALIDILSEIAGRDVLSHTGHYGRDAEISIANAAVIFGRIGEQLGRCENRRKDNRQVWPPFISPAKRPGYVWNLP